MNHDAHTLLTALGEDGYLSICWKPPSAARLDHVVVTLPEALATIDAIGDAADLWYGVNRMATKPASGRGRAADITRITCLYADLDTGKPLTPSNVTEARTIISGLPDPMFIVYSGHGLQPIWPVTGDEFTTSDPAILNRWGQLIADRASLRGWVTDNVYDLARILRVPGTVNHKYPDKPVRARMELTNGVPLTYSEVADLLTEHERKRPPRAQILSSSPARPAASSHAVREWLDKVTAFQHPASPYGSQALDELLAEYGTREASRHRWMVRSVTRVLELAAAGQLDAHRALAVIRDRFTALIAGERPALPEFVAGVAWGVGQLTPAAQPAPANSPAPDGAPERSSWYPRNLVPVLDGDTASDPPPAFLTRADGQALLYRGKINALIGESESGKTWIALMTATQALTAGLQVLYIDFEDAAPGITGRVRAFGVTRDQIIKQFRYIAPDEKLTLQAALDLSETLAGPVPDLIILDGVNAAMTMLGLNLKDNKDATEFSQQILKPLKRTGAAVLTVDHVTKDRETRGSYAIGAQAKRADVDGAALIVEAIRKFGRGQQGKLKLTVSKDRPGHVRAISAGAMYAGTAVLTSYDDGSIGGEITAPDPRPAEEKPKWRPTHYMERVSRWLEGADGPQSKRAIREGAKGKVAYLDEALDRLTEDKYLTHASDGYHLVKPYRAVTELQISDRDPRDPTVTPRDPGHGEGGHRDPVTPVTRESDYVTPGTGHGSRPAGQPSNGSVTRHHDVPLCKKCGEYHHRYGPEGRPCFSMAVTP